MRPPTHANAYQVLWLQLVDDGRQEALFGEGAVRARFAPLPFMVGEIFPDIYFEFPLAGQPFLDVTVLYGNLAPGTHIASDAAPNTNALLDWYATARAEHDDISFGFELDTSEPELPRAAIHFQPRKHLELVEPFCEVAEDSEKAQLYLNLQNRMLEGWDLEFFGMFRGRPGSPLRACGYLHRPAPQKCAEDSSYLAEVFDQIGFTAYDQTMLEQVSALIAVGPRTCDFQFDVYPDGSLGNTFAIDISFGIERPEAVCDSFKDGPAAKVFGMLEAWGAADDRWRLAAGAAFARAMPVELDDGNFGRYSFTLVPQWAKVRWKDDVLQPAKLYYLGSAGML